QEFRKSVMVFFFSSRSRHTRSKRDWSSDVCSSDLPIGGTPQELSTGVTTRGAHVSPDGGTAYVANRETLIGFDLEAAEVRVTYDIPTFDCESVEHPGMFQECQ